MILNEQQLHTIPVFGIAGNFAEHLAQAGEASDFVNVKTADERAPKGLFPIYIPHCSSFLGVYPLSNDTIVGDFSKPITLQVEPEICVLLSVEYAEDHRITALKARSFAAFNDCSHRRPDATKISQKKNWGANSTGVSNQWIEIDQFEAGGVLDSYHLCSFLKRDGQVFEYGIDSPAVGYNYFYRQLTDWMIDSFNHQTDFGPLENLAALMAQADYPSQIIVTLGATRYTEFGENGYLQPDDQIGIFVYDANQTSKLQIKTAFSENAAFNRFAGSALIQQVVKG